MVSLFGAFRQRFLSGKKNRRSRFQAIRNVCAFGENQEPGETNGAGFAGNKAEDFGGAENGAPILMAHDQAENSSSLSSSGSCMSAARHDEAIPKDPWPEILKQLTTEAKGKFMDGLESEKFITVGVGYRFLTSKKESFIGKHVNSKFIDLVVDILQTHMQLQYFRKIVSLDGLRLTIRNSRHIIYATVHRNLITVIAFDNLRMIPELRVLPKIDHINPCKSTLPITENSKLHQITEQVVVNPNWVSPSPLSSFSPISTLSDPTTYQSSSASSSSDACSPTPPSASTASSNLMYATSMAGTDESPSIPSLMNFNSQSSSSMGSLNEVKKMHFNHTNVDQKNFSSIFRSSDMLPINNFLGSPHQSPLLRL